ncbi:3-oxoadipate enol-lactonase 2 [Nocardioides dokdonensis FR1436]|uniref:3-oxoadipate enol-lactonase 2 n=1 Tax=Nocardioides dokdonensis FR1436 TaxID=1300347 RepID=A0A1A9GI92_9ACTN|nr:alpha/beta fold hydrolase [Nocardioides dokdonensis]ANH38039.1 3-oxoadipate enol-lactonase 2 [Nocardioides dokdonensis FR1436]
MKSRAPVTAVRLGGRPELPLLVLGPALGTTAQTLWTEAAQHLTEHFQVVAWDLPGHGTNRSPVENPFTMSELAAGVLDVVGTIGTALQAPTFHYAGDSVGGAVGLQLLLDAPDRVESATLLCTGAAIGTPESWAERIETVRASGTASLVAASASRWFGQGFLDRAPEAGSALLHALSEADDEGYAAVCAALARFDVRSRLGRITTPVLAVAGSEDAATPPASLREIADGVQDGRLVVLDGVAHLAPAESPLDVARLVREHALGPDPEPAAGIGDGAFGDLVTVLGVDGIWSRPGLDRRDRTLVALTALVAGGHDQDLADHVREARRQGLGRDEIEELLVHAAVYCGLPRASAALRVVRSALADDAEG